MFSREIKCLSLKWGHLGRIVSVPETHERQIFYCPDKHSTRILRQVSNISKNTVKKGVAKIKQVNAQRGDAVQNVGDEF